MKGNQFDICSNFHKGNKHSVNAHDSIITAKPRIEKAIITFLADNQNVGATAEEICLALNMRYNTISARCSELKTKSVLTEDGERKTSSGRMAGVLKLSIGANYDTKKTT